MIPKLIFIVPYRDRKEHKQFFVKYMEFIMEDYKREDYEIYFSHQCDSLPFNRGAMKNIGFLAMRDKYPNDYKNITFVFHDVDTLPYTKNLLPYETSVGVVKHFYGFTFTLGGIFSIKGRDFERTNGFPNLWGWSMEDNVMQQRVSSAKIQIDRSSFYHIGSRSILQFVDGVYKMLSKKEVAKYLNNIYVGGLTTIKDLKWELSNEYINVTKFTVETNLNELTFEKHDISKPNNNKITLTHNELHGDKPMLKNLSSIMFRTKTKK